MAIRQLLTGIAGSAAVLALASTAAAAAPDVTITHAKIAAGKLVIAGKTATPRMKLRLDGKSGADFNVMSKADKSFSFGVVYLPKDCIVSVQKLSLSSKVASSTDLVVANCVPTHISPRGDWSQTESYEMLDLVTHGGSSWLAKRDNLNAEPSKGADWQLFAQGELENSAGDNGGAAETETTDAAAKSKSTRAERRAQRRDPPTGPAGGDLAGTYPDPTIQVGAVVTNRIADGAVTSAKILDGAIGFNKMSDNAVTSATIVNNTITGADIADGSLTGSDITNSSLTGDDIASSSLTGIDIANSSLTSSDILDETLGSNKISDGSLTGIDIADSSLTGSDIAASSLTGSDIANETITLADIDGTSRSGSIDVAAISDGRCTTITGSVTGARPGDIAVLTTNGSLPNGVLVYAQRALTDQVHIKVCNLSGATSAAIVDLPVRVVTFR